MLPGIVGSCPSSGEELHSQAAGEPFGSEDTDEADLTGRGEMEVFGLPPCDGVGQGRAAPAACALRPPPAAHQARFEGVSPRHR